LPELGIEPATIDYATDLGMLVYGNVEPNYVDLGQVGKGEPQNIEPNCQDLTRACRCEVEVGLATACLYTLHLVSVILILSSH